MAFKLKSGNSPIFKHVGSSPVKADPTTPTPRVKKGLYESVTGKKWKDTEHYEKLKAAETQLKSDIQKVKTKLQIGRGKGVSKEEWEKGIPWDWLAEESAPESVITPKKNDKVTVGSPSSEEGWTTRKGDPWSYKETKTGYQTRKGTDGTIINVTDKKSDAYKAISTNVFNQQESIPEHLQAPEEENKIDEIMEDYNEQFQEQKTTPLGGDPKYKYNPDRGLNIHEQAIDISGVGGYIGKN